ncbi:MAG TPA: tRNA (guanosine(37)-N1)-methyltransferase TrmD [Acidobacteriaceae bacterium]|jgi:tRNA (guanine37-N1)-methyltransferase|nr:tRNA (guanosine(37)-N1)-methyltransferase TrmD [Acidobacteriaceae bacterium]
MRFDIITIFPEFFTGPFGCGVLRRALDAGLLQIECHQLRAFTEDKHQTVDDRPFGGGEGMVLKPEPMFRAVESLGMAEKAARDTTRERVVLLSAQGKPFTQAVAREMATLERVVLLCGRYEGVDERVNDLVADMELSIGDYVLSGGELAAAIVVDAVMRLLPGVLGNEDSARFESFGAERMMAAAGAEANAAPQSTCDSGGLLDYPHYTRPAEFRGEVVPAVLSSGNHEQIRRWRRRKSLEKTLRNRPDLLASSPLSKEDRALLREIEETRKVNSV